MKTECTEICIKTSLKEAYSCLWHFKWKHILISYIAFLPFTLAGLFGFLDAFFLPRSPLELVPEGYNLSFGLFIATTYLWAVPCFILWHRLYLLGPEHLLRRKIWPILTRSFTMIFKVLFLIGTLLLLTIILTMILAFIIGIFTSNEGLSDFLDLTKSEFARYIIIISVTGFFAYLVFLRFSLAISARAIGKPMGLITSWRLTKKNTGRMFCSFIAIFIPASITAYMFIYFYQIIFSLDLFYSGDILSKATYLHIFITAPIITLPLASMCSQCASFYRHCGGEECTQY